MSIVKVIEVIASSDKSWEHATRRAVKDASNTIKNIKHVYVESMTALVDEGEIKEYRVNAKVSFVVE